MIVLTQRMGYDKKEKKKIKGGYKYERAVWMWM